MARTHTRARRKSSIVLRSRGGSQPWSPSNVPKLPPSFLPSPRSSRPVNELQGCKSESWLNCLLSRVSSRVLHPRRLFLPPFTAVCLRGVAAMFLRPPLPVHSPPLKACAREGERNNARVPLRWSEGKLELFYYTGSFPILHGIASAKGETRAIHRRYLCRGRGGVVVHR